MQRWLKSYNNSQYEKYSKVFNRRRIVLHYKIYKKLCDAVGIRRTLAPMSTEQTTTTVTTAREETQTPGDGVSTAGQVSGVVLSSTSEFTQEKALTEENMQISTA
uniref:Uncharacterized protein n=1 Tax=Romanomermis culicivorax TaxID=13658 RepID=A0A915HH81_ROMCU